MTMGRRASTTTEVFGRNYAPAGYDRRHTFTIAGTYQLPFGHDNGGTLLNEIIRGWQINGTLFAYSGSPFTVTASNSALDQRGNLQTADQIGDVKRVGVGPDEPYYDPSAWANVTERRTATPAITSTTARGSGTPTCLCSGRSNCRAVCVCSSGSRHSACRISRFGRTQTAA
jgi:hypothetical protein